MRVRGAELLGGCPGRESLLALPDCVRNIKNVVLVFRPFQQTKHDETGHLIETRDTVRPDVFEGTRLILDDLEAIHGDIHGLPLLNAFSEELRDAVAAQARLTDHDAGLAADEAAKLLQ